MSARILYGVPFADYLRMPGVHFSTLKAMGVSPLYYRHVCDHERAETSAQRLGRLTHAAILTPTLAAPPEPVEERIVYNGQRRGKAWQAFREEHAGAVIVTAAEVEREAEELGRAQLGASLMRDAVMRNRAARALLADGDGEVTVTWEETVTGYMGPSEALIPCRARLDWYGSRGIVELKTTRRVGRHAWAREVAARDYHVQLAHYVAGVQAAFTGEDAPPPVSWIVVENAPPFDVTVYTVSRNDLDAGERKRIEWLRRVAECEASGTWPGVGGDDAVEFKLPDYAAASDGPDVDTNGIGGDDGEEG